MIASNTCVSILFRNRFTTDPTYGFFIHNLVNLGSLLFFLHSFQKILIMNADVHWYDHGDGVQKDHDDDGSRRGDAGRVHDFYYYVVE